MIRPSVPAACYMLMLTLASIIYLSSFSKVQENCMVFHLDGCFYELAASCLVLAIALLLECATVLSKLK